MDMTVGALFAFGGIVLVIGAIFGEKFKFAQAEMPRLGCTMRPVAIIVGAIFCISGTVITFALSQSAPAAPSQATVAEYNTSSQSFSQPTVSPPVSGVGVATSQGSSQSRPAPPPTVGAPPASISTERQLTAVQRTYLDSLQTKRSTMQGSMKRYAALVAPVQINPALLSDFGWRAQLAVELVMWEQNYADSKDVTPPTGLEDIDSSWIEYSMHMYDAAEDVANGISSLDAGQVDEFYSWENQGAAEISTAQQAWDRVTVALDAFTSSHI